MTIEHCGAGHATMFNGRKVHYSTLQRHPWLDVDHDDNTVIQKHELVKYET